MSPRPYLPTEAVVDARLEGATTRLNRIEQKLDALVVTLDRIETTIRECKTRNNGGTA